MMRRARTHITAETSMARMDLLTRCWGLVR